MCHLQLFIKAFYMYYDFPAQILQPHFIFSEKTAQRYNNFSRYANKNTDSTLTWSAVFQLQSYYIFTTYASFLLIIRWFLRY